MNGESVYDSEQMFAEFGEFLRGCGKRFETYVLFPPSKAYGALKLKRSGSFTFSTARMKLKWLKYDLFGTPYILSEGREGNE